jgi:type II secretory ATPase GspE/PulE/Tfp pilus assembly ATPase PilB-like protein
MTEQSRIPFGELLIDRGLINQEQLKVALQEQKITKEPVGVILERLGCISNYDTALVIATQSKRDFIDIETHIPQNDCLKLFNLNQCLNHNFIPMEIDGPFMKVIIGGADSRSIEQLILQSSGLRAQVYQGVANKINNAARNYYYFLENPIELVLEREIELLSQDKDEVRSLDSFVEHLFQLAIKKRATDIHVRPTGKSINVSFRIDGVLRAVLSLPNSLARVVSTLKTRARMDIAEQRLPQDGSFSTHILEIPFDCRLSTTIIPYGENLVIRMLPMQNDIMDLKQLGFYDEDVDKINKIFNEPHGMVLLSGPTGSGKTTTLYAAVRALNLIESNVLTVENPIEYRLPLVRQTEVNTKAGYTFASAIRHFLRHDPDIMLVGEIRDPETAETAVAAAETGHLLLSTLHTNTAFGAIPRLRSLEIPSYMIADCLVSVVSQRLVRRLCESCKTTYKPSEDEKVYLQDLDILHLYKGMGCDDCGNTGYLGRTLVYEIAHFDDAIRRGIRHNDDIDDIIQLAHNNGFRDIFQCAIRKVKEGITDFNEMKRVIGRHH